MKSTHYTKIILEGFQSVAPQLVFHLDHVGLNLIKGPNGRGKSTVFNAILWAEYGVNLKKNIATWEDRRPPEFRGTRVVVERTDGEFVYRVARHLDFKGKTTGLTGGSKLMLFKRPVSEPKFTDKHLLGDGLHKADMQKLINQQLGMDSKTFLSSIFFGQNINSLINKDNSEKRALFEQLFDVEFVENAKDKAREEHTRLTTEIATLETNLDNAETNLTTSKERLQEQEATLKNFADDKKERISTANTKVKEAKKKHDDLRKLTDKIIASRDSYKFEGLDKLKEDKVVKAAAVDTATKSYESAKKDVENCKKEQEKAQKQWDKLKEDLTNVASICPACEQAIKKTTIATVKKNIRDQIKAEKSVVEAQQKSAPNYDKLLKIADKNKTDTEKALKEVESSIETYDADILAHNKLATTVDSNEERILELKQDWDDAKESLATEKAKKMPAVDVEGTKKLIGDYEKILEDNEAIAADKRERLTKVKWWMSKGFSSSGLKAFVFNAMLAKLNTYAHKYSSKLGFRVEFSVDMSKESKPFQTLIYEGEHVRDYEDFSGGQAQRVDICIAFAMHDLITGGSDINILVMDEVFKGLDTEGVETVFELIREKSNTKSVYLISHKAVIDSLYSKSFEFALDERKNTYLKN